jgi:hypothetical protein
MQGRSDDQCGDHRGQRDGGCGVAGEWGEFVAAGVVVAAVSQGRVQFADDSGPAAGFGSGEQGEQKLVGSDPGSGGVPGPLRLARGDVEKDGHEVDGHVRPVDDIKRQCTVPVQRGSDKFNRRL